MLSFRDDGTNENVLFEILGTSYSEEKDRGIQRVSDILHFAIKQK